MRRGRKRKRSRSSARNDRESIRAADRRVVWRRQFGGTAVAFGDRQASERPRKFVGPCRPPLHGALGDDDAGISSVAKKRRSVPEDGGDQRLLLAGARQ